MAKCSPSTIVINRPSQATYQKCSNSSSQAYLPKCGDISPTACCDPSLLGPRDNRDRVREQIKDYVMLMLGAPVLELELDQQQLDLAVDHALQIIEEYAPSQYFDYHVFQTQPGKSVYKMPPNVGYIKQVYYRETGQFAFQASDLDGAIPVEYFYPGGAYASIQGGLIDPTQPIWGRAGEWTAYVGYQQMYSKMSSSLGGWEWVSDLQHIKLYPIPYKCTHVIVNYIQKCKDWSCITQSMQEGALAFAKIMLGRIRSRYKNIPGFQGGNVQDGDQILQEGQQEKKEWEERLIYRFGDGGQAPIVWG